MSLGQISNRWVAFAILCVGAILTVVDGAVVIVALPAMGSSLGTSQSSLVGVVNAYSVTSGGLLLCSGRLGDVFGYRRLFRVGICLFTLASAGCAVSSSYTELVVWRVVQGAAGSALIISTYSLAMILFPELAPRARALSLLAFISSIGGVLGLFLGGTVTEILGWRWVFLINLPFGVLAYLLCLLVVEDVSEKPPSESIDLSGALLITSALVLAVFTIQGMDQESPVSARTVISFVGIFLLLIAFLKSQVRSAVPLVPPDVLRAPNFAACVVISVLSSIVGASSIFTSMYLQLALHYTPIQVALAFLPASFVGALILLGLSARVVSRYGTKIPLIVGLATASLGLLLLARSSISGVGYFGIVVGLVTVSVGVSIASTPNLVAAMSEVRKAASGVATGVLATATMVGSSICLAALGAIFSAFRSQLLVAGASGSSAADQAYWFVFLVSASLNALAIPFAFRIRAGGAVPVASDCA